MGIIKERLEKVNHSYYFLIQKLNNYSIDHFLIIQTCQDSETPIAINGEDLDKNEKRKMDVDNYKQTINQLLDDFER